MKLFESSRKAIRIILLVVVVYIISYIVRDHIPVVRDAIPNCTDNAFDPVSSSFWCRFIEPVDKILFAPCRSTYWALIEMGRDSEEFQFTTKFFKVPSESDIELNYEELKRVLESEGVEFPPGSSLIVNVGFYGFGMRNTEENLNRTGRFVKSLGKTEPALNEVNTTRRSENVSTTIQP